MTMAPVKPEATAVAEVPGFCDPASETASTTLFIAGVSETSTNRASYLVTPDGERTWMPNSQQCYLLGIDQVTQESEEWGNSEKLVLTVSNAAQGTTYVYRAGLTSWASSSLLRCLTAMDDTQLRDLVRITLVPKTKATFVNVATSDDGGKRWQPVSLDKSVLSSKLTAEEASAAIAALQQRFMA